MDLAEGILFPGLLPGVTANGGNGRRDRRGHGLSPSNVHVEEGNLTDGRRDTLKFRSCTILQNDCLSCSCHSKNVRVLQSSNPSVGWEGVEQDHLEEGLHIRKQAHDMFQECHWQTISQRAGVA